VSRRRKRNRKSFYFYNSSAKPTSFYTVPNTRFVEVSPEKIDIRRIDVFGSSRYWTPDSKEQVDVR